MTELETRDDFAAAIVATARTLASEALAQGTAGNVSARFAEHVIATGSGVELAQIGPEALVKTDLNGEVLSGAIEPTSELSLHLGVYRAYGDHAGAVIHCHPPHATALSTCIESLPVIHYEQLALGGEIRVAPFAAFGTEELANLVVHALEGRKAAIMANHGAVAFGSNLGSALRNMRALEWFCTLYWRAQTVAPPRELSPQQQTAVIEQALSLGYGAPRARS